MWWTLNRLSAWTSLFHWAVEFNTSVNWENFDALDPCTGRSWDSSSFGGWRAKEEEIICVALWLLSDVCMLKSDPGPCKAYQPMWYFEPMEKACRRFLYGGCGGNANLFDSWEQCVRHCQTNHSATDPQLTTTGLSELSATASTDTLSTGQSYKWA